MRRFTRSSGAARRARRPAVAGLLAGVLIAATVVPAHGAGQDATGGDDAVVGPANGGFEEPMVDGAVPGWTARGGGDLVATVVTDPVYAGAQAASLVDPDDDFSAGLMSDTMPVVAGDSYQLSMQVYVREGHPTGYVYFYDDAGSQLDVEWKHFDALPADTWGEAVLDVTAPVGATRAAVYVYSSIARVSDLVVDEVTLTRTHGPLAVEDLGPAFYSPNVRLADTDVLADGTPVGYLFSDGQPVSLTAVDLRTGETLDSHEIAGYSIAASIEVAPDDTVYLSVRGPNDGSLWRYVPATGELEKLASRVAGERLLRTLVFHDGVLYGSTYPNAKVYAYDTATGEIRDYGSVVDDGSSYAWGMDLVDGDMWVGTGATPHLVEVAVDSGAMTEAALPPAVADHADFVNRVERFDDVVVLSHSPGGPDGNTAVYDLAADAWLPGLEGVVGPWASGTHDGRMYYVSDQTVLAYDVAARTSVPIGWEAGPLTGELDGTTGLALVELGTADFPGTTLVGTRVDGKVWRYSLATGTGDVVDAGITGAPATVHSMGRGGDGTVYVGAYLSAGVMARVDADGVTQLTGPKQADSVVASRGRTVVGTYPGAEFFVAEPGTAWDWGTNPRHLFSLGRGDTGQDRPLAMAAAGSLVAAGTVPNYGELGGALTLFDPDTGAHTVHRNVVADQSVTALAYRDGFVYGGTSIHGGLSSTPTATEAELFVWDVAQDELVTSSVVAPGAEAIHALTVDPRGRVWGLAGDGTIFEYDPVNHEVARSVRTPATASNDWGRLSELYPHPDGYLYGNADGMLFRFDPETLQFVTLMADGARHSAVASDGAIYLADSTNVSRFVPESVDRPGRSRTRAPWPGTWSSPAGRRPVNPSHPRS